MGQITDSPLRFPQKTPHSRYKYLSCTGASCYEPDPIRTMSVKFRTSKQRVHVIINRVTASVTAE